MKTNIVKKASAGLVILGMLSFTSAHSVMAAGVKMSVFEGYSSSNAALEGDYAAAIELAKDGLDTRNSYKRTVEATTLCVAYTKTKELESAKSYCELALENSTKASTLRNAAISYTDDISSPMSIVKVAEINHNALTELMKKY